MGAATVRPNLQRTPPDLEAAKVDSGKEAAADDGVAVEVAAAAVGVTGSGPWPKPEASQYEQGGARWCRRKVGRPRCGGRRWMGERSWVAWRRSWSAWRHGAASGGWRQGQRYTRAGGVMRFGTGDGREAGPTDGADG